MNILARIFIRLLKALGPYRTYRILNSCRSIDADTVGQLLNYWLSHEYPQRLIDRSLLYKYVDSDTLINILQQRTDFQDSPFYAYHIFAEIDRLCRQRMLTPKSVLEIGPGSSLGPIACFLANGADKASAVDIQPIKQDRRDLYQQLGEYLSSVGGFKWWRKYAELPTDKRAQYPNRWRPEMLADHVAKVTYVAPAAAERLPFDDNEFDLTYSIAVLEHVSDARTALQEIARVTKPGGYSIHEIDLRHHGSDDYIKFLTIDETKWNALTLKYGEGNSLDAILDGTWRDEVYCNRLRMSDWIQLFSAAGFEVEECEKLCVLDHDEIDRTVLSDEFRDKSIDDLATVLIRIVAKRQVGQPLAAAYGLTPAAEP